MFNDNLDNKLINYIIEQKKNSINPIKFLIFKKEVDSLKLKYFQKITTKTTYDNNTNIHLYKIN